jgi:23S rRNA (pseudouridine1915-N3)-methyltransferase
MKLSIVAVGRLRGGPDVDLAQDWLARADAAGRTAHIGPVRCIEVEPKVAMGARDREAEALLAATDAGGVIILMDERGENWTSAELARRIGRWRDDGVREVSFLIGGADGHGTAARAAARHVLAFGAQTWPHRLLRAMLAEQLYRAVTILTGSPYHRA